MDATAPVLLPDPKTRPADEAAPSDDLPAGLEMTPAPVRLLELTQAFPVAPLTSAPEGAVGRATDARPADVPLTADRSTRPGPADPRPAGRFPTVGETFLGFKLTAELGTGAFARVFLAEQTALAGRPVALKVTTKPTREPQRLAKLRHTNIVPIYSVHDEPPIQAVCMPFLGRQTLADLVKEYRSTGVFPGTNAHSTTAAVASRTTVASSRSGHKLPALPDGAPAPAAVAIDPETSESVHVELVLRLIARLADGLAHAHETGILHLDIKPANVLLADDGQPLLLDFNLAFDVRAGDRERAGGTLPYMAPEQLDEYAERGSNRVDHRTDLYALGVIFFELLTGRHPFVRTGTTRLNPQEMAKLRRAGAPSVRELNPAVSPAVESIVRTLLHPDPDRRYQSARDLLTDLDRHRQHLPLAIAPDRSVVERVRKWRRRNPRLWVYLLLSGAVLTAGGLGLAAFRQGRALAATEATAKARGVRGELAKLRVDLTSGDDAKARTAGLDRGKELLARYGLPGASDWADRPEVRLLTAADRAALGDDLGELALLMAHAEWLGGRGKPAGDQAAAADRALAWNKAAEACYAGRTAPAAVASQRTWLASGAEKPDPRKADPATESPVELYHRAAELMAAGRFREAVAPLEELTARDPAHFAGQFNLAVCRQELADRRGALERFQMAAALAPDDPRPAYHRGWLLLQDREYRAADRELTEALKRDPTHAMAYLHRGVTRTALPDYRGAVEDFTKALENGVAPIQGHLLRARVYDRLEDADAAERDRKAAADLTPTEPLDFVVRGATRLKTDPAGALADFTRAAELSPGYQVAWQNQAHVLAEYLHQPAKALEAQKKAVECGPDFGSARAGLAVLLARLGRRADAHAEAQQALLLSADPGVTYQVACVYALTSEAEPADRGRAVDLFRKALRDGYRNFKLIGADKDLKAVRDLPEFRDALEAAKVLVK